ncbi:MAG: T9SS type A sorting domain-containing protein [Ignavibacteriae bacterium]|nr:T9SS type A sorting domain-containing protein [Ignavibacteriota bacterium]
MTNKIGAVLSISIQRSVKRDDWERGFCDAELVGCEQRVIVGGNWAATVGIGSATADEILVQYAKSSPDGVKGICWLHGSDLTWNELPQEGGGSVTWTDGHACALRLYGGGGYVVGYNDDRIGTHYNQAYPMVFNSGTREKLGLRDNVYDDGMDYEYRKFNMTIPDRFIDAPNDGAYNFRFRIKVWADDNQMIGSVPGIPDDNDPFFVDNVRILIAGTECVDVECNSVRVLWPYSITPASQAIALPIRVKVSNNTGTSAPSYWLKVRIFRVISQSQIDTAPIYCRVISQSSLHAGEQKEIKFPDWNARKSPPGLYRIFVFIFIPYDGGDLEPLNDTTYCDFAVYYGDCYKYDPVYNNTNDVPEKNFGAINGRGLNLYGFSMGGGVYAATSYDLPNYKREWEAGRETGSGSGQFAMKFELFQPDTIFGYKAFFSPIGCSWSEIVMLSIYDGVQLPSKMIEGTEVAKNRGLDDLRDEKLFWDEYVTYLLPQPKYLQAGSYWMTISQQGETGLELGASKSRVGMRTLDTYTSNPPGDSMYQNGSQSIFLLLDKNLRTATRTGDLLNLNVFAYENTKGSNKWYPFMNTQGNPAYGHLEYRGRVPDATTTPTYTRGTWIPMIAPYFGNRTYGTVLQYETCLEIDPVELTSFNGQVRDNRVDLWWETASEINNYGFHIEKAVYGVHDSYKWNTIGFVKGQGTTNSATNYYYSDNNVEYGRTYHYRLRQVDLDGTQSCESYSGIVTLTVDRNGEIVLEPNAPNPFSNNTNIEFYLPNSVDVKIDVLDIYGNVVKTLAEGTLNGSQKLQWNATDNNGNKVSSGTYIFRLVAGDEFRTGKMTLVR